ncbi:hypothetical protein Patl1_36517 [Pistacia atlantica]|nr:hypothetical protein Patl1_36517 [Pistacia atlantica]
MLYAMLDTRSCNLVKELSSRICRKRYCQVRSNINKQKSIIYVCVGEEEHLQIVHRHGRDLKILHQLCGSQTKTHKLLSWFLLPCNVSRSYYKMEHA